MSGAIWLFSMLAHALSVQNAVNSLLLIDKGGCFIFCIKVCSHLDPANPLKVNVYNVFTQYMLVGSWVKVGNILLFEKH